MNHRGGDPAAGCLDVHVPPGNGRVIRSGHCRGRQLRLDLPDQSPQVSLSVRVLLQQIRQPRRPPRRQHSLHLLQLRPADRGEPAAGLIQPPLRDLGPVRVAAT
jgi:hypothetical protein